MSKYRTAKKAMKESYDKIICVGYCNLQSLLRFQEPFAYSIRAEGWACDYYDIDGVLISTGYAPIDSRRTKSTYDICRKYNDAALKICNDYSLSYEEQREKVNNLLMEYIKEVCSIRRI